MKDGISGIYYANDENIGFVPIDLINVLSVKENGLLNVKIYPNPTRGQLTIDNGQWRINSVEVFDVYGKKLASHQPIPSSSHHKIDISHLLPGIYFLKIETEKGIFVKKVLKI